MKNLLLSITVCGIIACGCAQAKELKTIQLNDPDTQRGDAVMTALKNRKSTREFSTKELRIFQIFAGRQTVSTALNREKEQLHRQ